MGSTLVRDYLRGEHPARGFYPASPFQISSFRRKLEEVQARFGRAEREIAAAALRPTSARARERLQHFVERGGAMITTGQQAGLLTGPLYTVHKALTVVRLARALEERLGTIVIPVFWTASEDHDWAEVNHVVLPVPGAGVRRLELSGPAHPALPMSVRTLGDGVGAVLDEASQVIAGQPYAPEWIKEIRGAYARGRTVAEGFSALLGAVLAPFDVCLTDAADPHLKRASVPLLVEALVHAEAHEQALRVRTRELEAAGYHAQVPMAEGATNVFYHGPQGRERLHRRGEALVTPQAGQVLHRAEIEAEVLRDPARFSPGALLRPVVESAVFPTLAYVGGPGELAYFAQVTALFPELGVEPPLVYPRGSLLLIEPAVRRLLERLELSVEALSRPRHELVHELAQGAMPPSVRASLEQLGAAVAEGYRRLIEVAADDDPALARALGAQRNRALLGIGESESKVVAQLKRGNAVANEQLDRVRAHLWPEGQPQDRVLNVLPYLARYGPELLVRMAEALDVRLSDDAAAAPAAAAGRG